MMVTIELKNLLFYAYHGVHEEEKVLGGKFEVNVLVKYKPSILPIEHLSQTINYVSIYDLVKKRMEQPTELLETIVTELAQSIADAYALAEEINISIKKLHPPIVAFEGSVGVSFTYKKGI